MKSKTSHCYTLSIGSFCPIFLAAPFIKNIAMYCCPCQFCTKIDHVQFCTKIDHVLFFSAWVFVNIMVDIVLYYILQMNNMKQSSHNNYSS